MGSATLRISGALTSLGIAETAAQNFRGDAGLSIQLLPKFAIALRGLPQPNKKTAGGGANVGAELVPAGAGAAIIGKIRDGRGCKNRALRPLTRVLRWCGSGLRRPCRTGDRAPHLVPA